MQVNKPVNKHFIRSIPSSPTQSYLLFGRYCNVEESGAGSYTTNIKTHDGTAVKPWAQASLVVVALEHSHHHHHHHAVRVSFRSASG